ncbi:MAG: insulinase family protein [Symbiobacteriaceae bacterium]|nr:insulinase family protein [Symbiobacteriaceae bacterium]
MNSSGMTPYRIQRQTLACGLRVILLYRPGILRKFAIWSVPFGSLHRRLPAEFTRRDLPAGIAHFLEHQLFRQEDGSSVSDAFATLGVQDNAFTSYDMTGYHFRCSANFHQALRLLLQFTASPYFSEESVANEKEIITQELLMYRDMPEAVLDLNLRQALYGTDPAGEDIGGTPESIATITSDLLSSCQRAFYQPRQAVLTVVGDISLAEVSAICEEVYEGIIADPIPYAESFRLSAESVSPGSAGLPVHPVVQQQIPLPRPLFALGIKEENLAEDPWLLLQRQIESDFVVELICGKSADGYWDLYRRGLIDNTFTAFYHSLGNAAHLQISSECEDPGLLEENLTDLIFTRGRQSISDEAIQRLKRKRMGDYIVGFEDFEGVATSLASAEHLDLPFEELLRMVTLVDRPSLLRRYEELFRRQQMSTATLNRRD